MRAIVDYEDVVVAICVQEPHRAGRDAHADEPLSYAAESQSESSQWNFTSADASALDALGAWPLLEINPFRLHLLQTRASSAHASHEDQIFGLSHDALFYRSIIASIQDKVRFVFVKYNPSARGRESPCLRATQCRHPGCMALLRAGLLPLPVNAANVTRLLPSALREPWFIASAADAHAATDAEISAAAKNIAEWVHAAAQFRLLEELSQDNFALYTFSRPIVIFFTGVADDHNVAIKRVLRAAAARFLQRVRFGHLNGLRYHGLALKMGVDHPAPSIILVDNSRNFSAVTLQFLVLRIFFEYFAQPSFLQMFPLNDSVSLANIDRWVSSHLVGTLPPTLRSGPGADGKWLQASQWHQQLQQNSHNMKFTLVAFTARWCGFCKGLPPLIRVIDQVACPALFRAVYFVTPPQILSQEALPVDVKLFDVDVNDAAVAASLVNVTSVPTLILIPPLPSQSAASLGSSTVCVASPIALAQHVLTSVVADTLVRLLCTIVLTSSESTSCSCWRSINNNNKHKRK